MKAPIVSAGIVLAATGVGVVVAQEGEGSSVGPGLRLATPVSVDFLYDDNVYRTDGNEESAFAVLVKPGVKLTLDSGSNQYVLSYDGEIGEYDSDSRDDYYDHDFNAKALLELTSRHRFDVKARYQEDHDPFGAERTAGTPNSERELDEWSQGRIDGEYTFGAKTAKTNLHLRAGTLDKEYDTNRTDTRFLDYSADRLGAGISYNVSPKTALTLDYEHQEIEYDSVRPGFPSRDGEVDQILAGARWLATAKTVGRAQVGYYERTFDDSARDDVDGIDWLVDVTWSPRSYSSFVLESGRIIRESYFDVEDFINARGYGVKWLHQWSSKTRTELGVARFDFEYEANNNIAGARDRDEDHMRYRGEVKHDLSRLWAVKAGFELDYRDSNLAGFDYDKNVIFLGLDGNF